MKKWILVVAVAAVYYNWGQINAVFNPPPNYADQYQSRVVLYATSWCGYCAKARALLKASNVPFVEFDIEKSAKALAEFKSLGGRGVPVLQMGGEVVLGYNERRIKTLISRL